MKFTKIPADTFSKLQLNAGILLSSFTPATGTAADKDILGATSGGVKFTAVSSFKDWGEDIDNCPKNTMELKKIDSIEVKMVGSFVTANTAQAKMLIGAADIDTTDTTKVTPRADLKTADFSDIWLVGDYSDLNGATNGGFIAIHMMNSLSTGGFSVQTSDKDKGKFDFEFTGHFSMSDITKVPYEMFIKAGTAEA